MDEVRRDPAQDRQMDDLDAYLDRLASGRRADPGRLDPDLAATARRYGRLIGDRAPADARDRVWELLTAASPQRGGPLAPVVPGEPAPNGRLSSIGQIGEVRPRRRPRRWWPMLELAAMVTLVLGLTLTVLAGDGSVGSLRALWPGKSKIAREMPMYRGGAARTGEQPGPGPAGVPVERWRLPAPSSTASNAAVVVAGGTVFAVQPPGVLVAVSAEQGVPLWRVPMNGAGAFTGTPAVVDGVVYAGDRAGTLFALAATTGEERWRLAVGAAFGSSVGGDGLAFLLEGSEQGGDPAVVDGVVYFARSCSCVVLHAIDLATGTERWTSTTGEDGLYALDAATGVERWRLTPEVAFAEVAVARGTLYATDANGVVVALDVATGGERWRATLLDAAGAPVRQVTAPAVSRGLVFVAGRGGTLHALDAATGEERWRQSLGATVVTAPTVAAGVVYLGTLDGALATFDAETGAPRWSVELSGWLSRPPAVVGGFVYAVAGDGAVVALADPVGDRGS